MSELQATRAKSPDYDRKMRTRLQEEIYLSNITTGDPFTNANIKMEQTWRKILAPSLCQCLPDQELRKILESLWRFPVLRITHTSPEIPGNFTELCNVSSYNTSVQLCQSCFGSQNKYICRCYNSTNILMAKLGGATIWETFPKISRICDDFSNHLHCQNPSEKSSTDHSCVDFSWMRRVEGYFAW